MSYEALTAAQFEGGKDVYVSAAYTGYADASGAADNSKVKVTKSYTPVSGDEIGIGSRVRVSVRVEFAEDAPSGLSLIHIFYRLFTNNCDKKQLFPITVRKVTER